MTETKPSHDYNNDFAPCEYMTHLCILSISVHFLMLRNWPTRWCVKQRSCLSLTPSLFAFFSTTSFVKSVRRVFFRWGLTFQQVVKPLKSACLEGCDLYQSPETFVFCSEDDTGCFSPFFLPPLFNLLHVPITLGLPSLQICVISNFASLSSPARSFPLYLSTSLLFNSPPFWSVDPGNREDDNVLKVSGGLWVTAAVTQTHKHTHKVCHKPTN